MKGRHLILAVILIATLIFFININNQEILLSPQFNGCSDGDNGQNYYLKTKVTVGNTPIITEAIPELRQNEIAEPDENTKVENTLIESISPEDNQQPIEDNQQQTEKDTSNKVSLSPQIEESTPNLKKPVTNIKPITETSYCNDVCVDPTHVKECFCDGDYSSSTTTQFCPNGCIDGACVEGEEPYCSHIGTTQQGWYRYDVLLLLDPNCDEQVSECKTPGFSGVLPQ